MRDIRTSFNFLHFFETFFTWLRFPLPWWSKISWWRICRWRAVNFEIHVCSSDMNSDCIWRSTSIQLQYVQIEAGLNSDLGNGSFWVEFRDAKHVDQCRSTHRLTQVIRSVMVWSHQLTSNLWHQEMFTFFRNACAGRVWKQFRCLRLSQEACGAPPRLALLLIKFSYAK